VEIKPITVPQPNGAIKLGAGAAEMTPNEINASRRESHQAHGTRHAPGRMGQIRDIGVRPSRAREKCGLAYDFEQIVW
jgi:hypothetical protein